MQLGELTSETNLLIPLAECKIVRSRDPAHAHKIRQVTYEALHLHMKEGRKRMHVGKKQGGMLREMGQAITGLLQFGQAALLPRTRSRAPWCLGRCPRL